MNALGRGEWALFGSDAAEGPMGLRRCVEADTDVGLQIYILYLGFVRRLSRSPQPLLMIESNVRLMERNGHDWLIVELMAADASILSYPAEVMQADASTALLSRSHQHLREVASKLASSEPLKVSIRDPESELVSFVLSPSRIFVPLYRSVLEAVRIQQDALYSVR